MIIATLTAIVVVLLSLVQFVSERGLGLPVQIPIQHITAIILAIGYLFSSFLWIVFGLGELGNFTKEYVEENASEFNRTIVGVLLRCGCLFFGPLLVLYGHELLGVVLFIVGIVLDRTIMALGGEKVWTLWSAD